MSRERDDAPAPAANLRTFTHEPLSPEVRRALERVCHREDVVMVAAMPDVHLSREVCVGAVVATRRTLMPDAVGGDIGCGMAALRFDAAASLLDERAAALRLLERLGERIPVTAHTSARARLPAELAVEPLSAAVLEKKKQRIGRVQFATLGRGNHFVELQRDEADALWLMLHSGSRGIGQGIRDHHGGDERKAIPADSPAGHAYLGDMQWALAYARASRRAMAEAVAEEVGDLFGAPAEWQTYVDCHHNFVRFERHLDQELWVHRKGAISAEQGEPGIIPGSMGSPSYHVTGRGHAEALGSSSHGAGRAMSRTEARRVFSGKAVCQQMRGVWFDNRLADRLRDEAPGAYKEIGAVMRAQRELTRIARMLAPVLVYKGS